jgi:putative addiction module killer protein
MAKKAPIAKKWTVNYWTDTTGKKPVKVWLDDLTQEELKSVAKELELLKECGNTLRLPHSLPLKKGLFELRERRYHLRIYYGFYHDKIIILFAAGDKGTQEADIKIARERLQKLMNKEMGKK